MRMLPLVLSLFEAKDPAMSILSRRLWLQGCAAFVMAMVTAPPVWANPKPEEAVALIQKLSNDVLAHLQQHPVKDEASRAAFATFVEREVLPHFNLARMTSLAVGSAWRQASSPQRERLIAEFRQFLLRTYTNAAKEYNDERLEFAPLRVNPGDPFVRVGARVVRSGAEPIPVEYVLEAREGRWQVFDVIVAGVSLVTSYRSSFAAEIERGGIDGLIRWLAERNARGEVGEVPGKTTAKP